MITTIMRGELDDAHIPLINSEEEYVKQRYFAVARTIAPDLLRITRNEAAEIIGLSRRQLQRIVKRFREEGIEGLRKKSTRPNTSPKRIPEDVEKRIVEVRKATGFGPEIIAIIVNKVLEIEGRKSAILHATMCLPGMFKLKEIAE